MINDQNTAFSSFMEKNEEIKKFKALTGRPCQSNVAQSKSKSGIGFRATVRTLWLITRSFLYQTMPKDLLYRACVMNGKTAMFFGGKTSFVASYQEPFNYFRESPLFASTICWIHRPFSEQPKKDWGDGKKTLANVSEGEKKLAMRTNVGGGIYIRRCWNPEITMSLSAWSPVIHLRRNRPTPIAETLTGWLTTFQWWNCP